MSINHCAVGLERMKTKFNNPSKNHFTIYTEDGRYLLSYVSKVAFVGNKQNVILDRATWAKSPTTSRYRNVFLDETTAETTAKIDSGEYTLADLNTVKSVFY